MSSSSEHRTTHFGFRDVPESDKAGLVGEVFSSVASNYDLMNDLMSLGMHRVWKAFALARTGLAKGDTALDLAAGTGDLTAGMVKQVGESGHVFHTGRRAKKDDAPRQQQTRHPG